MTTITRHAPAVTGIGSSLPAGIVTNDMLVAELDTTDEWIRSRTGIERRHVIDPDATTSDLAVEAGARAMKSAGLSQVDMVIVATTTPDRSCPAMAPSVATALGLVDVPAFDLAAVCSGFLYALQTADAMIRSGACEAVLVIAAEAFTTLLDPEDRTTRVIFGDGAGAVVLQSRPVGSPGEILAITLGSDGSKAEDIVVHGGGVRERLATGPTDPYFRMQGASVFLEAVRRMDTAAREVLDSAGWEADDLELVVAHQANARIIAALAHQLGLPAERAFMNIQDVGNTAAASIPIAIADAAGREAARPGSPVLLAAYGGGATWGAAAIRWPDARP